MIFSKKAVNAGTTAAAHLGIVMAVIAWAGALSPAWAETAPDLTPDSAFTWVYLGGSLAALTQKMGMGSLKHFLRGEFQKADVFWTLFVSLFYVPLVIFFIMPQFGRPTGRWFADASRAFLVTYNLFDVMNDLFQIKAAWNDWIKLRIEQRRSQPPAAPAAGG